MGKVYVETKNGLIVGEALTATARILSSTSDAEVTFTQDAAGPYFVVSDEHMDAFMAEIDAPPKKRRAARRAAKPEAVEEAAEPEAPEADSEDTENPDIQE